MPTRRVKDGERRRCSRACDNCQRRKQRCDGAQPCWVCKSRNRGHECHFSNEGTKSTRRKRTKDPDLELDITQRPEDASRHQAFHASLSPAISHDSKVLRGRSGPHLYFGDSSNISLLQAIRRIAVSFDESCSNTMTQCLSQYEVIGDFSKEQAYWLHAAACPGIPSLKAASLLVRQFLWATGCIVDLFDEVFLIQHLPQGIESSDYRDLPLSPLYYLVFAIGTQASPEGDDETEKEYLNHGRYLTTFHSSQGPTVITTQCHALITWYLLGAGRVNEAYIHLGTAVHAAYALGLHIEPTVVSRDSEAESRAKLWKVIRVLDGFLSLTLGRPTSLRIRTQDARINGSYSACLDLCVIFESIVDQWFSNREASPETVEKISAHHRRWAARYHEGLETDRIKLADPLQFDDEELPNIGLFHLKEAFYRSIILLTLPFLTEYTSNYVRKSLALTDKSTSKETPQPSSDNFYVYACVNSAISIIEMLQKLLVSKKFPKRLPFVVNSVFISTLIIGLSFFGDLDHEFPLGKHLNTARELLVLLGCHDPTAKVALTVVKSLNEARLAYLARRDDRRRAQRNSHFESIFGDITYPRSVPQSGPTGVSPSENAKPCDLSATEVEDAFYQGHSNTGLSGDDLALEPLTTSTWSASSGQTWQETDVFDPDFPFLDSFIPTSSIDFCTEGLDDSTLYFEDQSYPVLF